MEFLSRFFARGRRRCVGLDLGSWAIKLVELKEKKLGEFHLLRLGVEPLSPEAIVDGAIMDSSLVVDAIHRLNDVTKVKNTNYAISLSGHSVLVTKIQLPAMSDVELAESIQWEAEQYIPWDINDVRLDYMVLSEGGPGRDTMEILLVAVKRDKVNDYVSVISQTGKTPAVVDIDAFAVQLAYELNYDLDPHKVVALINMGAGVTNINILARGTTVFWRDISFGGNQFTEALQREFNLSFPQAEALKHGEQVDRFSPGDARMVLDFVSAEMANELRKTFDFFSATSSEGPVDELMLSGGCSLTPNLEQVLRDRFQVPTELMNPLRRVHFRESDFDSDWLRSIAPMMAVSVGLALRGPGDGDDSWRWRKAPVAVQAPQRPPAPPTPMPSLPKPTVPPVSQPAKSVEPVSAPPAGAVPPNPVRQVGPVRPSQSIKAGSERRAPATAKISQRRKSSPARNPAPPPRSTRPPAPEMSTSPAPTYFKCFISYSHIDGEFASRLAEAFEELNVPYWRDEKDLKPGDDLHEEIHRAIEAWDKVLVCCSQAALKGSTWVDRELDKALQKEERLHRELGVQIRAIIPLDLDGYLHRWDGPKASYLRSRVAADFTNWRDPKTFRRQLEKLLRGLRKEVAAAKGES